MKFIFKQRVTEYTLVDADNQEDALETFYSGEIDAFNADYHDAPEWERVA